MVVTTSPGDQTGCRILQRLESLKINIRDPGQNRVYSVYLPKQVFSKVMNWLVHVLRGEHTFEIRSLPCTIHNNS